jgi:hypothetical protein
MVAMRDGSVCPAQALPEGVLRLLALVTPALDSHRALWCLEAPESSIFPPRLPALLQLLRTIPASARFPLGPENPLRQLIITTHAPALIRQVPADSLLLAGTHGPAGGDRFAEAASFAGLRGTWRDRMPGRTPCLPRETLDAYLQEEALPAAPSTRRMRRARTPAVQQLALDPA